MLLGGVKFSFLFFFERKGNFNVQKIVGGGALKWSYIGFTKFWGGKFPSLPPLKCTYLQRAYVLSLFKGYITIQAWVLVVIADIWICSLLLVSYCPQLLLLQDIITSLHKSSSVVMCRYLYNFNEDVGERLSQDWTSLLKLLGPVLELAKYQQGITLGWWVGLVWSCDVQRDR